ncbi:MAG: YegP family protein [Candidatus Krumholzibacteria bacterium]|nr:YegP family protein [Candidatus Krumholzibacteria bacterium]
MNDLYRAEVYKGRGLRQRWRFRIIARANGQIVEASEGYYSKWNAKRAIRRRYPNVQIETVK